MRTARAFAGVAMTLALQTTLDRFLAGRTIAVDLVLVSIVYVALTRGPARRDAGRVLAGLIQDALSSGVIGIGGMAKTIVGFLAGAIGQQFIVTAAVPRMVMFVAATALHAAMFMGLYLALGCGQFPASVGCRRVRRWQRGRGNDGVHRHRGAAGGGGAPPPGTATQTMILAPPSERTCR